MSGGAGLINNIEIKYVSWHQIDSVEKELTGKEDEGK